MSEFKAAAAELRGTLGEIEARQSRKEYAQLLRDCHGLLAEARVGVLMELVQDTLLRLSSSQTLPEFCRSGFHFLMQVTLSEHSLFTLFFSKFDSDRTVALVVEPLGHALYDLLRPEIVALNEIEALCEVVDIVKGEIIDDRLARYGDQVASMRPFAARTLADTQERLIFSVQTCAHAPHRLLASSPVGSPVSSSKVLPLLAQADQNTTHRSPRALLRPPWPDSTAGSSVTRLADTGRAPRTLHS